MRISRRPLAFAAMAASLALCSAAAAQETAQDGVFQGHGIVRAVESATGAVTIAHDEIKGLTPAMEVMYQVQEPQVSECMRPGDTVDFSTDPVEHVIVRANLLYYDQ
jgi:Cu/Ag efflux protein CusF